MFGKVDKTTGDVSEIAGLGELVPSVSLYQTGNVSVPDIAVQAEYAAQVTFSTPMPDGNYEVSIEEPGNSWGRIISIVTKTTSGFSMRFLNCSNSPMTASTVKWTAFKLMTDQQTALDEAQITKNKNNTATTFSTSTSYAVGNYCIHDGNLYRCTTAHSGAWNASHFTATNVTNAIAKYNDTLTSGHYSSELIANIKATADAVNNYTLFQGDSQAGAEAAWFGLKKTSTYWHCTIWDGHGVVSHLVYKDGNYTCNVIHEGVSSV